jgi:hypothetical protein
MTLSTFFESVHHKKQLPHGNLFSFFGKEFPILFFNHVLSYLRKNNVPIESFNCLGIDSAAIKALLSTMSFTGSTVYWLENFHTLPTKKQQELFEYIRSYTGPHCIMLFSDTVSYEHSITLPETIPARDFGTVRFLVNESTHDVSSFLRQLSQATDQFSLDAACLFAHYEIVLGKVATEFFTQWVPQLIEPTHSLFLLSQYLLGKKDKLFFRQWATMSELYLPPFWAIFWADQLWRAYVFCDLMKNKKYAEAKKAQYKLPFSFINRDWSSYNATELSNAHHFLTTLDFQLKNGSSEIGLEHFYIQFFSKAFF